MKVAAVLVTALVICIAIPGSNQGKGKTKFCTGADGNRYKKGESYEDEEACLRYTCIKSRNKFKMKKEKIKPCPKPEIEQNLAANVTSLESKFQALQESVQSLQTTMDSVQGMMATIQSTSSKLETNISSNMEAINTNKKSITTNEGFISTNNAALAAKDKQMEMNITSAMEAINTNKQSISTNNAALAAKDTQMEMNITSNMEAINTNKESISTNNAALAAKDTQMESCFADISSPDCPSPASGKTSLAEGISANTAALDDKCDASTCSDIQEAIAELQKDVNIVVTGGHFGGKNLKSSEIISPDRVCSQGIPPLPVAVHLHQSVYFNNSLMVCGGYGDNGNQKRCHQLRNSNSQWTEGPAMNIGRHHFSMTKAGQDLYALGGSTAAGYTDSMEKLSGSSGEWTLMDQKLTSIRAHHCTVFMKTTNSLVTVGGQDPKAIPYNVVEEFNLATLTWKQLASLPITLTQPACVALDQTIVVIGGYNREGGVQKKVYHFSGGNWQTTGELEIAKHFHTVGIIDNKLIVIGGAEDPDGIEEIQNDGNFKKVQKKLSKKIKFHASTEVPRNDFTCS